MKSDLKVKEYISVKLPRSTEKQTPNKLSFHSLYNITKYYIIVKLHCIGVYEQTKEDRKTYVA